MADPREFRGNPMPAFLPWAVPLAAVTGTVAIFGLLGANAAVPPMVLGVLVAFELAASVVVFAVLRAARDRSLRQRLRFVDDQGILVLEHFRLSKGIRTADWTQRLDLRPADVRDIVESPFGIEVTTTRGTFLVPRQWPRQAELLAALRAFAGR